MKVLISGGVKTQNIVKGLEKKFTSGGVDFIVVPFIEDIDSIYQRGEYFDRALIIEQCWNKDFTIKDETIIRRRINDFASRAALRSNGGISFIFLAQTKEVAEIVYEEILEIQNESTVVIKAPQYTVSFFLTLVTSDIDKLPEDILYKPEVVEPIQDDDIVEDDNEEENIEIPKYDTKNIDNIEDALFGNDVFDSTTFDGNDTGVDLSGLFDEVPEDFESEADGNIDNASSDELDDISDDFDDNLDDGFDDLEIPVEVEDDYIKSGEIPDFSGDVPELYDGDVEDGVADDFGADIDRDDPGEDIQNEQVDDHNDPDEFEVSLFDDDDYTNILNDMGNDDSLHDEDDFIDEPQYIDDIDDEYDYEQVKYNRNKTDKFKRRDMDDSQLRATLDAFASRGNSIVVTGCGGCGTSLVAYNLANTIVNLGYTCLLVDMDTNGRAQSYISRDSYDSIDSDGHGLVSAINSSSGINAHIAIIRQCFHLLTLGLGSDIKPIDQLLNRDKLSRFANLAKTSHHFIIYDMPFKTATDFAKDLTFMADNIVLTVDSSTWGVTKTMLEVCNIESDDMQDTIFSRAQLLFNKYRGLNKVLGRKVKSAVDITKAMDRQVLELIGEDTGYYFQNMHICGVINDDNAVEEGWFSSKPYSETPQGQQIFTELLCNIVLKR